MAYLPILVALVAVAIAIYYYIFKDLSFFKKHGILHIPPAPIFGNMGPYVKGKSSIVDVVTRSYNIHPDAKYVGFFDFMQPIILIRDPELQKSVCIKNFEHFQDHRKFFDIELDPLLGKMLFQQTGEKWKNFRSLVSPTFTSSKIKTMFKLMSNCATSFSEDLCKLPEKNRDLELKDLFTKYTNDVIASCVFGFEVNTMKDPNNPIYVNGRKASLFAGTAQSIKLLMQRNVPGLARLLGLRLMTKQVTKFFENIITNTVAVRDEKGIHRPDMLQLLMDARNKNKGESITIDEITAQAFTFYFGGFDTVSTQSCFAIYQLAINPDIQQKLQNEVDQVYEQTHGDITYEALQGMTYLDAVINESMRMYPIAPFLDRLCVKSFDLPPALPGGKPFTMEPGMIVWIPVYSLQNDPTHFEDPEKFDPERFINDGKRIMNSGTYVPFGVGPRMCIGNRFALNEMKILFCNLLARCDIKCGPKTANPLKLDKHVFGVTADGGFWVRIEPRKEPSPYVNAQMTNGTCKMQEAK